MRAAIALSLAAATLLAPAVASADGVIVVGGGFRGGFRAGFRARARAGFAVGVGPIPYRPLRFSRPPAGWYGGYASAGIGIGVEVGSGPSCDYYVPPPPPPVATPCCVNYSPPTYYPTVVAAAPRQPARVGVGARLIAGHAGDSDSRGGDYGGVGGYLRFAATSTVAVELAVEALRRQGDDDSGVERSDIPVTAGVLLFLNGPRSSLRPFLSGGLGYTMASADLGSVRESEGYAAGYLGLGLSAKLSRGLRLDLEARYNRKDRLSDQPLTTQLLDDKTVQTVPLLPDREEASEARAGLTFVF